MRTEWNHARSGAGQFVDRRDHLGPGRPSLVRVVLGCFFQLQYLFVVLIPLCLYVVTTRSSQYHVRLRSRRRES